MPRISVVVPIYNVEPYLDECLASIASQTFEDLEVVMVDDGSTDGSEAVARAFAARDERFQLLRRANGGLGSARNAGADRASGEFLAFVDGDDVLEPDAYARLLGALDRTGSDFASGNVLRLTETGTAQAPFVARAFADTRLRTHVSRRPALLADRTAWNKLWRRSFWDTRRLRFPEGVVHEDIPVTLPAHFMARSVDVLAEPVYRYRIREGSITQRRLELRVLADRLAAVEHVARFIGSNAPRRAADWYLRSVVRDDLRRHLELLEAADDGYRELFVERAAALLEGARRDPCEGLPAIDRLKWHLVRRRSLPELLEVLRFAREDLAHAPAVRRRGRWYGDYPFRTDRGLGVPASVYRLGGELALRARLESLRVHDGRLRLRGAMHIHGIGAPSAAAQRIGLALLRPGRMRRIRLRTSAVALRSFPTRRGDVPRALEWSGFEAAVDVGRLAPGRWDLYAQVAASGLRRRWSRFAVEVAPVAEVAGDVLVRAHATAAGRVIVEVHDEWVRIRAHRLDGEDLVLSGDLRVAGTPVLGGAPLVVDGSEFGVRIPLADAGTLAVTANGHAVPVVLERTGAWLRGGRELLLTRTRAGEPALVAVPIPSDPRTPREVPSASRPPLTA